MTGSGENKAVIYARVSSKEQEREGYSIPAQTKLLNDYASQNGLSIVQEYIDVETAKRSGRKSFSEMVAFLKKERASTGRANACRTVLVEKTDRLYRNVKDWVTLDELGLEIHLVKEGVVLSSDSRSSDKFMHGIKVLMAKNYIDNLSEETKKGMYEKAAQGVFPSKAPLGYVNVQHNGNRHIQPDPDLAPVVTKLFEWYATGRYSVKDVARKAYEEGLAYRKSGGKVSKGNIWHILTNPIYYGDFEWGGKRFRGTHEPLVSRELWDKVQDVLAGRASCSKPNHSKHQWAFQGLLSCGHCGCALTAEIEKGKYVYYHCTGQRGKCPEKYVREEEVDRQFRAALEAIRLDANVLSWVVSALKASHADQRRYRDAAISTLRQQYTRLQNRLDRMYDDKLDGRISQEMFDRKSSEWKSEMDQIMRDIEAHQKASESCMADGIRILELLDRTSELYGMQDIHKKRRLLDFAFSNSSWIDGMLFPNYRKPFDLIVEASKMHDERAVGAGEKFNRRAPNGIWLPD